MCESLVCVLPLFLARPAPLYFCNALPTPPPPRAPLCLRRRNPISRPFRPPACVSKMSMNPFCEIAVEEAVRLKEKKVVSEITAVSIGPKASAETLRTALAMGADSALHIETDMRTDQELQPLAVAKLLAWVTKEKSPDFWILGKQVRRAPAAA